MNLEFTNVRIVGDLVIADHPTLPSIDVTRYLTRGAVDALVAQESLRQIAERREYLRDMGGSLSLQAEALYQNTNQRRISHVDY